MHLHLIGLLEGCKQVLSIDVYFIKGPLDDQVMVVVGTAANNKMHPLA